MLLLSLFKKLILLVFNLMLFLHDCKSHILLIQKHISLNWLDLKRDELVLVCLVNLSNGQRVEFFGGANFTDDTLFSATFDGASTAKSRGGIFILTRFSDFALFAHTNHLHDMLFEMKVQ